MEHVAPLIQTVLWVGLLSAVLWKFYKPIYGILTALQKRIDSGSNVEAGPFKLSDQLKPQDPSQQKEKVELEVKEAILANPPVEALASSKQKSEFEVDIPAEYFQAEDLALRAIQVEYGSAVMRQVTLGGDATFDGLFVTNGRLNVVEIRYVYNVFDRPGKLHLQVERLTDILKNRDFRNAQIILAVVFERSEEFAERSEVLQSQRFNSPYNVVVRCYLLAELRDKFGIAERKA